MYFCYKVQFFYFYEYMKKAKNISTVLFGLDGVIVDTEQVLDKFWTSMAEMYGLKINNFSSTVDGMTMNSIIDLYFTLCTPDEKQYIRDKSAELDAVTDYAKLSIPGVLDFINYLKGKGYKLGIVTSSGKSKADNVLKQLKLEDTFDTIITAESIKKGKPDPMGYVLAQTNLGVQNTECVVFEDAFTGIKAATYAFMRVIGVATTLSEDYLKDYTYGTIKDFTDTEKLESLLK